MSLSAVVRKKPDLESSSITVGNMLHARFDADLGPPNSYSRAVSIEGSRVRPSLHRRPMWQHAEWNQGQVTGHAPTKRTTRYLTQIAPALRASATCSGNDWGETKWKPWSGMENASRPPRRGPGIGEHAGAGTDCSRISEAAQEASKNGVRTDRPWESVAWIEFGPGPMTIT